MPDEFLMAPTEPDEITVPPITVRPDPNDPNGGITDPLTRRTDPIDDYGALYQQRRATAQRDEVLDRMQDVLGAAGSPAPPAASPQPASPPASTSSPSGPSAGTGQGTVSAEFTPGPPAGNPQGASAPAGEAEQDTLTAPTPPDAPPMVKYVLGWQLTALSGVNKAVVNSVKSIDDLTAMAAHYLGTPTTTLSESVPGIPGLPEAQTLPEHLVEGLAQWSTLFVPMAAAVPEAAATGIAGMGLAMARMASLGTLSELISMDPYDPRFSNMMESFGLLPAYSRHLRAEASDSRADARWKQAVEATIVNAGGEGLGVIAAGIYHLGVHARWLVTHPSESLAQLREKISSVLSASKKLLSDERGSIPNPLYEKPLAKPGETIPSPIPDPSPEEIAAASERSAKHAEATKADLGVYVPPSRRVAGGVYQKRALPEDLTSKIGQITIADTDLESAWNKALQESSSSARDAVAATGATWKAFPAEKWKATGESLPQRARYWYEVSSQAMREFLPDLNTGEMLKFLDLIGATSAQATPKDNLERAIAIFSEYLQHRPISTDALHYTPVELSLSRTPDDIASGLGNKTGNFANTTALTMGYPVAYPTPVNDLWMARIFGIQPETLGENPRLHEVMSNYIINLRDVLNSKLPQGADAFESWQLQAMAWVLERQAQAGKSLDAMTDFAGAMPGIVEKLQRAGIAVPNGALTRDILMDPRTPGVIRPAGTRFAEAPKATIEIGTRHTPNGQKAAQVLEQSQALGVEANRTEYAQLLASSLYSSSRGADNVWNKTLAAIANRPQKISRIMVPTQDSPFAVSGTYQGAVSPNIYIPLKGVSDTELQRFNALVGEAWSQDAMASAQTLWDEIPAGYERSYGLFLPMGKAELTEDFIRNLSDQLGHDVSVVHYPNGAAVTIHPKFEGEAPVFISPEKVDEVAHALYTEQSIDAYGAPLGYRSQYGTHYLEKKDYGPVVEGLKRERERDAVERIANITGGTKADARRLLSRTQLDNPDTLSAFSDSVQRRILKEVSLYREWRGRLSDARKSLRQHAQALDEEIGAQLPIWEKRNAKAQADEAAAQRAELSTPPDPVTEPQVIKQLPNAQAAIDTLTPIERERLRDHFADTQPDPSVPPAELSEGGFALRAATHVLARMAAGAVIGPMVGDPEDALRNAMIGAGLGAFANRELLGKLVPRTAPKAATAAASTPSAPASAFTQLQNAYLDELQRLGVSNVSRWGEPVVGRSDAVVAQLATNAVNTGEVSQEMIAQLNPYTPLNQVQTRALSTVMTRENEALLRLAHETDPMNPQEVQRLLEKVAQVSVGLDAQRLAVRSEQGRAMREYGTLDAEQAFNDQFSNLYKNLNASPSSVNLLIEALKNFKSHDQMALFLSQLKKASRGDVAAELWYAALLSGFPTHLANLIGNASTMVQLTVERAVAARLPGSTPGTTHYGTGDLTNLPAEVGEAAAMWKAFGESFWEILREAGQAFRDPTELSGVLKAEGLKPAISSEALQATGNYGRFLDWIGPKIRLPGRALAATDAFFKGALTRMEQRALAHRHAMAEVRDRQLDGAAADQAYAQKFADLMANPPEAFVGTSQSFAEYGTFTQDLTGPIEQSIEKFGNTPVGRIIIPFKVTPINITKFAANRTPLGFFAKSLWNDIAAGGAKRDLALARLAVGNMMTMGFGYLAYHGLISGSGPDKQHTGLRNILQDLGWRPYSINVSALRRMMNPLDGDAGTQWQKGDILLQYNKLAPIGAIMGWAADVADAAVNAGETPDPDLLTRLATAGEAISVAGAKMFTQGPYVKGVADAFRAMAEPETYAGGFAKNFEASLIPQLLKKATQEIDPVIRDIDSGPGGYLEALMAGIPGLSSRIPPRLDRITGDPIYRPGPLGWRFLSPVGMTNYTQDPVLRELANAGVDPSHAPDQIGGVALDRAQKHMWLTLATKGALPGEPERETLYDRLKDQVARMPVTHPNATPELKRYIYGDVIAAYAENATLRLQGELRNAIAEKARQDMQTLRGPAPAIGVQ